MTHDPYRVEKRKPLTKKQMLLLLIEHDGRCCICGEKIQVGQAWDEHINPLWLDGDNSASNRAPAHEKCARQKSADETSVRAKIRRVAEKHFGPRKAKTRPMPGSKASGLRKRMNGTVERRK